MLKTSISISAFLHVSIGAIIVTYFMFVTHTPPKPKEILITAVVLPSLPKVEPIPPKPQEPQVVEKLQPKKKISKPIVPKPVIQETKLASLPLPKPEIVLMEEKPVEEPQEIVKQIEPEQKTKEIEPEIYTVENENIKNKYLGSIYQSINKLKVYPRNAKRLGQSGTTEVAFTVLAEGTITNIYISGTSGFEILDDAAKKILITLAKADPIPKELKEQSIAITVPISYRIE